LRILQDLNYLSEILPLFLCVLFFKKNNSKEIKVFFVYKIFIVFLLIGILTVNFTSRYIFVSISVVLEFILLSLMYYYIIKSAMLKKLLILSALLFTIFWCYSLSQPNFEEVHFDFIPLIIESLFFIAVIIYYYYEIMRYNYATPLFTLPSFWLSVAFLIFFSGNFFILLYAKTMFNDPGFDSQFMIVTATLTIIKNILLCVALFVNKSLMNTQVENNAIPSNLNLDTFQPLNKQPNY
jgi:hypothetical protein